jgi:branched-chain amino acid transport system permease protein
MKTRLLTPPVLATGLLLAAALLLPLLLDPKGYVLRVITVALLFAAMSQAWNIVGGLANQMSLGHAAFFGLGAYASTILLVRFGLSPWIGMLAGMALGAVAAVIISLPTLRLQGHYFALATLAFGEVMRLIANAWTGVTGGPVGLSVPFAADSLWLLQFRSTLPYYYLMLAALVVVSLVFWSIKKSRLGWRLRAVREHAEAAAVIGVDTTRVKLQAAIVSAVLTAGLGTLYAQFNYFFDPDTVFGVAPISVRVALIAIIGGIGTLFGPILGAFLIIPLEELANTLFAQQAAGLSQFAYGALLIAMILAEPRGLLALAHWRPRRAAA